MRRSAVLALVAVMVLATVTLIGCGGGGGSSATGNVALFVMDGPGDDFAHVWATVHRVEIATATGPFQTIVDSTDGIDVDLPALADSCEMLGLAAVPSDKYTRLRLTLRDRMQTVARDGSSADRPLHLGAGGFAAGASGQCTVNLPLNVLVEAGATADLPIDFDLAGFAMVGDALQARIRQGDANQFRARPKNVRLTGTVTNLVAGSGFDLRQPNGRLVRVALQNTTTVVSATTGAEIALADGQFVHVFGTWDAAAGSVGATVIVVMDAGPSLPRPAHIRGTVTAVSGDDRSFVVEPFNAYMNFRPTALTVKVQATDTTVFGFIPRGPASFADVQVGSNVDVLGAFEDASGTISARRVFILKPRP